MARERQQIAAEIEARREQFNKTVAEMESKFDIPAQRAALGEKMLGSYQTNPLPWWIGAGVVGVVIVSAVAWAVFGDD